jgi:hypothetical protein
LTVLGLKNFKVVIPSPQVIRHIRFTRFFAP